MLPNIKPYSPPARSSGQAPKGSNQSQYDTSTKTASGTWFEELKNNWYEMVPYVQHWSLAKAGNRIATSIKIRNGTATQEEKSQFDAETADEARPTTWQYDTVKVLSTLPANVFEFITTAGIGKLALMGGEIAAKSAVKSIAKSVTTKIAGSIAKEVAEGVAKEALDISATGLAKAAGRNAAHVAAMTIASPFSWANIAESTAKRMTDVYGFTQDEAGQLQPYLNKSGEGDDFWPALLKATGTETIGNFAAQSGGAVPYLDKIAGKAGLTVSFKTAVLERAAQAAKDAGLPTAETLSKTLRTAGWAGVIDSTIAGFGSMRVGDVLRYSTGLQPTLFDPSTLGSEALAFGIFNAGMHIKGQVAAYKGPSPANTDMETLKKFSGEIASETASESKGKRLILMPNEESFEDHPEWGHLYTELKSKPRYSQGFTKGNNIFLIGDQLATREAVRMTYTHELLHPNFDSLPAEERLDIARKAVGEQSGLYKEILARHIKEVTGKDVTPEESIEVLAGMKEGKELSDLAGEVLAEVNARKYADKTIGERLNGAVMGLLGKMGISVAPDKLTGLVDRIMAPAEREPGPVGEELRARPGKMKEGREIPLDVEEIRAKAIEEAQRLTKTRFPNVSPANIEKLSGIITTESLVATDRIMSESTGTTEEIIANLPDTIGKHLGGLMPALNESVQQQEVKDLFKSYGLEEPILPGRKIEIPEGYLPETVDKLGLKEEVSSQQDMFNQARDVGTMSPEDETQEKQHNDFVRDSQRKSILDLSSKIYERSIVDKARVDSQVITEDQKSQQKAAIDLRAKETSKRASAIILGETIPESEIRNGVPTEEVKSREVPPSEAPPPPSSGETPPPSESGRPDKTPAGISYKLIDELRVASDTPVASQRLTRVLNNIETLGMDKALDTIAMMDAKNATDEDVAALGLLANQFELDGNFKRSADAWEAHQERASDFGRKLESLKNPINNPTEFLKTHRTEVLTELYTRKNTKGSTQAAQKYTTKAINLLNGVNRLKPTLAEKVQFDVQQLTDLALGHVDKRIKFGPALGRSFFRIISDIVRPIAYGYAKTQNYSDAVANSMADYVRENLYRMRGFLGDKYDVKQRPGEKRELPDFSSAVEMAHDMAKQLNMMDKVEALTDYVRWNNEKLLETLQTAAGSNGGMAEFLVSKLKAHINSLQPDSAEKIESKNDMRIVLELYRSAVEKNLVEPRKGPGKAPPPTPFEFIVQLVDKLGTKQGHEVVSEWMKAKGLLQKNGDYSDIDYKAYNAAAERIHQEGHGGSLISNKSVERGLLSLFKKSGIDLTKEVKDIVSNNKDPLPLIEQLVDHFKSQFKPGAITDSIGNQATSILTDKVSSEINKIRKDEETRQSIKTANVLKEAYTKAERARDKKYLADLNRTSSSITKRLKNYMENLSEKPLTEEQLKNKKALDKARTITRAILEKGTPGKKEYNPKKAESKDPMEHLIDVINESHTYLEEFGKSYEKIQGIVENEPSIDMSKYESFVAELAQTRDSSMLIDDASIGRAIRSFMKDAGLHSDMVIRDAFKTGKDPLPFIDNVINSFLAALPPGETSLRVAEVAKGLILDNMSAKIQRLKDIQSGKNLFDKLVAGKELKPVKIEKMAGKINKILGETFKDYTYAGPKERAKYIENSMAKLTEVAGLTSNQAANFTDAYAEAIDKKLNKLQMDALTKALPKSYRENKANDPHFQDILDTWNSGGMSEKQMRERLLRVVNQSRFSDEFFIDAQNAGSKLDDMMSKVSTPQQKDLLAASTDYRDALSSYMAVLAQPNINWQERLSNWTKLAMLSGPGTAEKMLISNAAFSSINNILYMAVHSKGNMAQMARLTDRWFKAILSSPIEAVDTLLGSGVGGPMVTTTTEYAVKYAAQIFKDKGIGKVLNTIGWVGKTLNAIDTLASHPAYILKALMVTDNLLNQYGIQNTPEARNLLESTILFNQKGMENLNTVNGRAEWKNRVSELKAIDPSNKDSVPKMVEFLKDRYAAVNEAVDVLKGLGVEKGSRKFYRDLNSMMFETLDDATKHDVKRFMGVSTMNIMSESNFYKETTMGRIASGIVKAKQNAPMLNFIFPFVSTLANVYNFTMDFTPWGYVRAKRLGYAADEARRLSDTDINVLKGKFILGSTVMMGLGLLAANAFATAEEDEEPWFGITGTGSADATENARMRANGWMPYSFKMGNTYFSYKEGPLAIGAAIIGSALDAWKYNKDQNAYTKMTYALARIPDVLLDNSFLSSGINLFEILGDPSDKGKVEKMARFTQRVITSPVPNLFRQLERLYEDRSFTSDTYYGGLMKNIPVVSSIAAANGMVRPRLNALGEDIHLGNPSISLSIAKGAASGMGLIEDESTKTGWLASISSQDPAWAKISRLDLKVPLTRPSELKLFGLDMTDDEKYTFSKIKGGLMKNLVNGIDFEKYSPEVRAYIINRYNRKYNLALQNYLLMERLGKEG